MPITPRCQPSPPDDEDVVRADRRVGFDGLFRLGDELGLLGLAAQVLVVQLLGEPARFVDRRFVGREQQTHGDVRRAHPAGRVHTRRQDEADVVAVDRLAGQARRFEQRAQADGVRARC